MGTEQQARVMRIVEEEYLTFLERVFSEDRMQVTARQMEEIRARIPALDPETMSRLEMLTDERIRQAFRDELVPLMRAELAPKRPS